MNPLNPSLRTYFLCLSLIIAIFFIAACETASSQPKEKQKKYLALFDSHSQDLRAISLLCHESKAIRWSDGKSVRYNAKDPVDAEIRLGKSISAIVLKKSFTSVRCERSLSVEGAPLVSVNVAVETTGLSVSGSSIGYVMFVGPRLGTTDLVKLSHFHLLLASGEPCLKDCWYAYYIE